MNKFQNKYRIPSARLQSWDYGSDGLYFITICTAHREPYFGEIVETHHSGVYEMMRNDMGQIAHRYWTEIPNHFPFIELGNYVVMPNHVHGILIINKPMANGDAAAANVETPKLGVSITESTTAASKKWKPATIGVIINQYKRKVTIECRKIHADFGWQSRFHDHIIRDAQSFENIQYYIETNPQRWAQDKFNQPTE